MRSEIHSFSRPRYSDLHRTLVEEFISTRYRNGMLAGTAADCLYCPSCQS